MINTIISLWYIWVTVLAVGFVIGYKFYKFKKKPTDEQIKSIKEWLIIMCVEAERILGSGTGKLKLRLVYDWFIDKFPAIAPYVPFNTFVEWLEEALEEAKHLMETNENVADYVNSGE